MQGATDIRLSVTMDASQARAEAERLHRELERRYRAPSSADALKNAWDNSTGMPRNEFNPDLPYEHTRHSGIWWANQRGIRGLGNQEYRHQFFTEREAKYMGMQFAKQANKEFISGAKGFALAIGAYALNTGINSYYGWQQVPGLNNRQSRLNEATVKGGMSGWGVGTGAAAGLIGLAALIGAPFSGGTSLALLGAAGAIGGGIGAWGGRDSQQIADRNSDVTYRNQFWTQKNTMFHSRRFQQSDAALQRQMQMMPSRVGKLQLIENQLEQITNGKGFASIKNLEGMRDAMLNGTKWGNRQFNKGDLDTMEGQRILSLLQEQYGRREGLLAQQQQIKFTPFATPQDAITDSYSQRGLFVGAQVDVQDVNRVIVSDLKRIIKLLDETRKNTADFSGNKWD